MLWIVLFIIGLLALLVGLVPLLLNGLSKTNFAAMAIGTVLLAAGIAGVVIHPRLPLAMPSLASLETAVTGSEPEEAPSTRESIPEEAPPAAEPARVVEPAAEADPLPSPSLKDESQLEPSPLPDPVPVTTTTVPGEPDALAPPTPVPSPAAAPAQDTIAALALAAQQPKDQSAFAAVIKSSKDDFDAAATDEREAIQPERATAICKALPKPEIKGWIGTIQAADKDSTGRLTVTVALPDGTLVKTWNNAMSDIDDNTLVAAGSPLAQALGKMQPGDAVRFSGSFFADEIDCYRSSRLALSQSMMEPSFLFRFTAIEKL